MKKIIQLSIFFIIIISLIIFYKSYFLEKNSKRLEDSIQKEFENSGGNNTIKNLKYDINLDNNTSYSIKAAISELNYDDNDEIIKMNQVEAIFIGKDKDKVQIFSDFAVYNRSNNETYFEKNVLVKHIDHNIFSNKLKIQPMDNLVKIFDKVIYNGPGIELFADHIDMNLITKKINIYMSSNNEVVEVKLDR